jgi:cell division protein FtsQ
MSAAGRPPRAATGMARRRVRRRDVRRLLVRGAVALGIVAVVGAGVFWLLTAPRFAVARVETDRYRFTDRAELEWRLRWALGRNIWRFDTAAFTDSLRLLPWVRDAEVSRLLPSTLHVRLQEWRPQVVVAGGGDRDVLIENGRRLRLPAAACPRATPTCCANSWRPCAARGWRRPTRSTSSCATSAGCRSCWPAMAAG